VKFAETAIRGAWIIEPEPKIDHRGFFARVFCVDEFQAHGLESDMVQANTALSHRKGTVRGLHFQRGSSAEAKLVRCSRGAVHDVVLDLRSESPTFKRWVAVELSADNRTMLYIPRGCAHGYQTLTDDAELWYAATERFAPTAASGVRFDDPAFGITWPLPVSSISDADAGWPDFVT
jgi:dTDP-4-dehydrorhamnose 3,5-epimerase